MNAVSTSVSLSRRGAERWRRGHPWIFRSDLLLDGEPPDGAIVGVREERRGPAGAGGGFAGQAFWSANSKIALRFITRSGEPIDEPFWRLRLTRAIAYRDPLTHDTDAYRLVAADADGIPGLIVDRYGPHLVLQTLAPGPDRMREVFAQLLEELLRPESILARNDVGVRTLEGLPRQVEQVRGETPALVEAREGSVCYLADLRGGQKTGAFLDQRENRLEAARYCRGRVLDLFCYHASFALHAAKVCDSVTAVDSSAAALERGRSNARLNGLQRIEFVEANAFDFLRSCDREGRTFQAVFLDPPAFAKSRADVPAARRAYKEINLRAMKVLEPEGFLITSSCSYNFPEAAFLETLQDAAADLRRRVRIVERRGASRDHPARLGLPESQYLKCFILQV